MHEDYGGVVPELASRDHIRRVVPLIARGARARPGWRSRDLDGIAYTQGPGLAGALLVGRQRRQRARPTRSACPAIGVHHLEGHLLSPLLAEPRAAFPVRRAARLGRPHPAHARRRRRPLRAARRNAGRRGRRGLRQDREAARACGYPGGPGARAARRAAATPGAVELPRPMLDSGDLDFSFSGLKTAVLTLRARERDARRARRAPTSRAHSRTRSSTCWWRSALRGARARPACATWSSPAASARTAQLRARLRRRRAPRGGEVFFPDARVLHRQRRDDRVRRRAAARARAQRGDYAFTVQAALGSGGDSRAPLTARSDALDGGRAQRPIARSRARQQLADVRAVAPEQQQRDRHHRPRDRATLPKT